jgi:hypothetical protein
MVCNVREITVAARAITASILLPTTAFQILFSTDIRPANNVRKSRSLLTPDALPVALERQGGDAD